MTRPEHLLADAVSGFCELRFADVAGIAGLAVPSLTPPSPRREDLAIERHCLDLLATTRPPLAGAGVVVAPHVLVDDPYWLEWWLAGPEDDPHAARRLTADLNPASVAFRDYTSLAWFTDPRTTGERTITGPYVDYLCTDQYTLTFTAPLVADGRFLGVAGVDVLARWFEEHLFTVLDEAGALDEACVVVNRVGRVVACPAATWVTGDLVRELGGQDPGDAWEVTPCPGTPFVVARRRG